MGFSFTLSIGGKALKGAVAEAVQAIEWVESLDELDALRVVLEVPEGTGRSEVLKLASPGKAFELEVSAPAGTLTATGDVIEAGVRYAKLGQFQVVLHGLEPLHRLRGSQAPKLWKGAPNTFFSTIAGRHSLSASAQGVDGAAAEQLQASEDDALFVKRLAREYNYYARVNGKKLEFGRRHVAVGKALTVKLADVFRMSLDTSLFDPVTKVTVLGSDPTKAKAEIKGMADPSKLKKISGGTDGPSARKSAFGARELIVPSHIASVVSLANALAAAEMQRRAETFVRGELALECRPDAQSGTTVKVEGAPWPLGGPFLIRQTRHVIRPGRYETVVEFMSDSLPRTL